MKVQINAPVISVFVVVAILIHLVNLFSFPGLTANYFMIRAHATLNTPLDFLRLFTNVLGHANADHLFNNLAYILLLGPFLEEKFGSRLLLLMMVFTALATGIVAVQFYPEGMLGASGIVFMFVLWSSIARIKEHHLPFTFVLIVFLFLGQEAIYIFRHDQISHGIHLLGGGIGTIFGLLINKKLHLELKIKT